MLLKTAVQFQNGFVHPKVSQKQTMTSQVVDQDIYQSLVLLEHFSTYLPVIFIQIKKG
jgi:hypothetical protein